MLVTERAWESIRILQTHAETPLFLALAVELSHLHKFEYFYKAEEVANDYVFAMDRYHQFVVKLLLCHYTFYIYSYCSVNSSR